jgi:hypothetical protein
MVVRHSLPVLLALVGAALGAGCSSVQCGDRCEYGSPYAGMKYECTCETCGPNCGPSCHEHACGCAEPTCAVECGDGCGKSRSWRWGLGRRGCNGCGELYWSEWFNDPPACCEPCDCHGNYIGPGETGYFQARYLHQSAYPEHPPTELPPLEVAPSEPTPESDSTEAAMEEPAKDLVNPSAYFAE